MENKEFVVIKNDNIISEHDKIVVACKEALKHSAKVGIRKSINGEISSEIREFLSDHSVSYIANY